MTVTVYGIPNCDSVKKARALLTANGVEYAFHDYKKAGVPEDLLRGWVAAKGWETLLNRKCTTWRSLDDSTKLSVLDADSAVRVMFANLSTIKRPVIVSGVAVVVGVDETAIASLR
jgi:Spx/MgsR family transcriptional regulator